MIVGVEQVLAEVKETFVIKNIIANWLNQVSTEKELMMDSKTTILIFHNHCYCPMNFKTCNIEDVHGNILIL